MRLSFGKHGLPETGVAVVFSYNDDKLTSSLLGLDKKCNGAIQKSMKTMKFKSQEGKHLLLISPTAIKKEAVLIVGMKKRSEIDIKTARDTGKKIYEILSPYNFRTVSVVIDKNGEKDKLRSWEKSANVAYGALLASYSFDKYKSDYNPKKAPSIDHLKIMSQSNGRASSMLATLENVSKGVFLARDLINEPANVLYPDSYVQRIKLELEGLGVSVEIFDENRIKELGMGAFYSVGQGSAKPPRMVVMQWNRNSKHHPIAIVGKGVTFDSGGTSLKPGKNMHDMKSDMAGSAVVVGLMKTLALRNANANVVGIVGLAENMPSSKASRPGDVVKTLSGKYVEIINTDAEGRLILADCLTYAQNNYNPSVVIDIATLTGAMVVSLGAEYAGFFSNQDNIAKELINSGNIEDEKVWRLPLDEGYKKLLKSKIADICNVPDSGNRSAGSIVAAEFLQSFIEKGVNWMHIDTAGVSTGSFSGLNYYRPFGVQLLNNFISSHQEHK